MSEQSLDSDQEPIDNDDDNQELACYMAFHLTDEDDLVFDAAWSSKENLKRLAQIICLIQNSDFIMSNIRDMDTDSPEDIPLLEQYIEEIDNRPAIYPMEVFND